MTVDSTAMLINGLQTQFTKTYREVRNRQADSRLAMVMDLDSVTATNRQHDFGYREAAPHLDQWVRGEPIPTEGMASQSFNVVAHNWGKRLEWHEDDREDDQAQDLMQAAATTGQSVGLLAELFFFDLILGTANTLPTVLNAPDGNTLFNTATRFETSNGNTDSTAFTASSTAACVAAYYRGIARLKSFKDGKGQPLWSSDVIDGGTVIICSSEDEKVWEEAFKQKTQIVFDATTDKSYAAGISNIVQDANRNITLWPTSRVSTNEAYMFLKNIPVKCTFVMNRRAIRERSSLGDMNNSDRTRTTGMEYTQWDLRQGAGINVPYGCIKFA